MMKNLIIFYVLSSKLFPPLAEDATLLVPQLIRKYGYPIEIHHATTSDGYILEMHRIPNGKSSTNNSGRPVVLVFHGLLMSSAEFVFPGPNNGLAYVLADGGYDVWLGNARGNRYSKRHVSLDTESREFWDFSFHEIGIYDIPAMIKYITDFTGSKDIFYVGHSQGTTSSLVMCSEVPEMNSYIRAMFNLAPGSFLKTRSFFFGLLVDNLWLLQAFFDFFKIHHALPRSDLLSNIGNTVCSRDSIFQDICIYIVSSLVGFNPEQVNRTTFQIMLGHTPAGFASKQVLHYGQILQTEGREFAHYDYGPTDNMKRYGSVFPPSYNLHNVKVPLYLYKSNNDFIILPENVDKLASMVSDLRENYLVPNEKFNHIDFLYAKDVVELVYKKVLSDMEKHL